MNDLFPSQSRKKITSLFSTEGRYSRSGSITTATLDKEEGIRQSRIMNLPNYKKETLECRLDFVVVFQTIEIQRLSVQIQSLRVRLADSQRQIFNYKSYEVQIRELTQRCYDFQSEKNKYEEQISKLKLLLRNAQAAESQTKNRWGSFEDRLRQREDQLFRLKQQLIIQRKQRQQSQDHRLQLQSCIKEHEKLHSKQIREIQKSTKTKRNQISKNEEHLEKLLKKYHEEVTALQKENSSLRNLYESLETQSREMEQRYDELREQFYRNNQSLKEKDFQLESLDQEYRERIDVLQQRYEQEINSKQRKVQNYQEELNDWKTKLDKMEYEAERYEMKLIEYTEQCEKYESLLNQAGDQIDRLNTIIKDKIKYLQAWQTRFKELEQTHAASQQKLAYFNQKQTADQEELTKLSQSLKHKEQQLQKLQRIRQQETKSLKQKLNQSQYQRQEMASMRKQKDHDRQDFKRLKAQNVQIKEQLSRRINQGNKIFQQLNKAQNSLKDLKMNFSNNEAQLKKKDQELRHIQSQLGSFQSRIDKLQRQKRSLEQQAVKVKALEERVSHQENKKNEYLNEGKKVTRKLKETEKQKHQLTMAKAQLQQDMKKYQKYTQQLLQKIKVLEDKLSLLEQLIQEIKILKQKEEKSAKSLKELKEVLQIKSYDIEICKQKLAQYQKAIKDFFQRQQSFKKQTVIYDRMAEQLKMLKLKYEQLQDHYEQLQINYSATTAAKEELQKENGSLERIITINTQQLKRIENQLQDNKQEIITRKQSQKELFAKIKQSEKRVKLVELQVEKEKTKSMRQKQDVQKQCERKMKDFQDQFKFYHNEKERTILQKQKQIQEMQMNAESLINQNQSIKTILQRYNEEKEEMSKLNKELERKIAGFEHDLERTIESKSQTKKQLEISLNQLQLMNLKFGQAQDLTKQQTIRIKQLLTCKQNLSAEVKDLKLTIDGKQKDIAHLLQDNKHLKQEITSLQEELSDCQQNESGLIDELIKLKFKSENITQCYSTLNTRLINYQGLIIQLKQVLAETINKANQLSIQKDVIQKKSQQFQDKLLSQIENFEQQQYKANEDIIRLETMIRLLQLQLGEFKDRETAVFSIVREGSLLKEKKQEPVKNVESPSKKTSTTASRAGQKSVRDDYSLKQSNMFIQNHGSAETLPLKESRLLKESRMLKQEKGKKQSNMQKSTNLYGSHNQTKEQYIVMKESIIEQIDGITLKGKDERRFEQQLNQSLLDKKQNNLENTLNKSKRIYFQNIVFKEI